MVNLVFKGDSLPGNECKEAVLSPQLVEGTDFNCYFYLDLELGECASVGTV